MPPASAGKRPCVHGPRRGGRHGGGLARRAWCARLRVSVHLRRRGVPRAPGVAQRGGPAGGRGGEGGRGEPEEAEEVPEGAEKEQTNIHVNAMAMSKAIGRCAPRTEELEIARAAFVAWYQLFARSSIA